MNCQRRFNRALTNYFCKILWRILEIKGISKYINICMHVFSYKFENSNTNTNIDAIFPSLKYVYVINNVTVLITSILTALWLFKVSKSDQKLSFYQFLLLSMTPNFRYFLLLVSSLLFPLFILFIYVIYLIHCVRSIIYT